MTSQGFKVGMWVTVNVPDKPHLTSNGFILIGPLHRDGDDLYQVDMGDHDNWFPADWLTPLDQGGSGSNR